MEASQPEGTLKAQRQISVKKKNNNIKLVLSYKTILHVLRVNANVRFHCFICKSISAKPLLVNILKNVLRNSCMALVFQKDEKCYPPDKSLSGG